MENPFEVIARQLSIVEEILLDIKHRPAPSPLPGPEPVSPEELCRRLDISKPTVWAWEKKGVIRGYHLGNRKYYIWQEVIADLKKGEKVA